MSWGLSLPNKKILPGEISFALTGSKGCVVATTLAVAAAPTTIVI